MSTDCYLSEIYSAIQGEGLFVGHRQIFLRLSGCDLRCSWCDTPDSLIQNHLAKVESHSGMREFAEVKNPISSADMIHIVSRLNPVSHHSISITGGEPLLQSKFLVNFLPDLKTATKLKICLETGGHNPIGLKSVIEYVDYISMDFKLKAAHVGDMWNKHEEFLKIAINAQKPIWVKMVITSDVTKDEILRGVNLVKMIDSSVEVFLQPVTPIHNIVPLTEVELLKLHEEAILQYPNVRVIPQMHALLGLK